MSYVGGVDWGLGVGFKIEDVNWVGDVEVFGEIIDDVIFVFVECVVEWVLGSWDFNVG